jgi:hypothetical protein
MSDPQITTDPFTLPRPRGPLTQHAQLPASSNDTGSQLAYLTRVLRAPALRESIDRVAGAAREQAWSYEEFLAAVLHREVTAREAHGSESRIRAAGFSTHDLAGKGHRLGGELLGRGAEEPVVVALGDHCPAEAEAAE